MSTLSTNEPLLPGSWLGMLGGGQLGRMFCHAAQAMGYRVAVLDPDPDSPAGSVADRHFQYDYDDENGLVQLAGRCQAVTTEFENVPAATLSWLAERVPVRPGAAAVAIAQDRIREKGFFGQAGVPVAPHAIVRAASAIEDAPDQLFPGILKAARLGYDGKGQIAVSTRTQAMAAWNDLHDVDCVLEARLNLESELSIVLARDSAGNMVCYPPVRNEHRDGILAVSVSDALVLQPELAEQARHMTMKIATELDYVGVLCVEFFILEGNRLVVNEMAPRPHNSGHYTMDASACSQFEQQVRALASLPLGATRTVRPAVMLNILGDIWFRDGTDTPQEPAWDQVLAIPEVCLHLYGKTEVRRGRKMGHVNIAGKNPQQVFDAAVRVATILGIPFWQ